MEGIEQCRECCIVELPEIDVADFGAEQRACRNDVEGRWQRGCLHAGLKGHGQILRMIVR
ncbi:hypothetical protein [Bradyrhizobium sp. ORS 375]|uniref:hypothetical protein n=1 Tax=Bradyrhizobium sp. (strain ORS 375) TaxID=566679 RepID=UPI001FCC4DAE|nr:hypothetical protein [Bradyrhizobium sp. ORS 375]